MKVMDEGEVGEIVQGGVQVGIGNLSRSRLSSTHLPDLQQSNVMQNPLFVDHFLRKQRINSVTQ